MSDISINHLNLFTFCGSSYRLVVLYVQIYGTYLQHARKCRKNCCFWSAYEKVNKTVSLQPSSCNGLLVA